LPDRTDARGGRITAPRIDLFLLAGRFPPAGTADAVRRAVSYGVAAEAAGFDACWLAEHHFLDYGCCPSATTLAGYLLGATSRLHIGTAACILSIRHPVALAEEAALLSSVSGGRFLLGVARGGPWIDLTVFGTGLDRFEHGFPEALDVVGGWLSGVDSYGADGERFRFPPVRVVPQPVHPVPVYVAATSPATVDIAAARGLPLLLGMHASDVDKAALLSRYADVAGEHGHDPATIGHASAHLAFVADSRAEACRRLRATMPAWLATTAGYRRIDGTPPPRTDHTAYLDKLLSLHPAGTPEQCAAKLAESVAATGVHRVLLMPEGTGDPTATHDNITRLGTEVAPLLRNLTPAAATGTPGSPGSGC
jgi:alkanesulfonate monooxygenase SsuD/methylene tetrahydromethanopterin reductase-like flavin-dependent oxidoreductase (luciferase family)